VEVTSTHSAIAQLLTTASSIIKINLRIAAPCHHGISFHRQYATDGINKDFDGKHHIRSCEMGMLVSKMGN
jgi:hypothetical protein